MVTKHKSTREQNASKRRVKVGKLQLNKETLKDLSASEKARIKGAARTGPQDKPPEESLIVICH